MTNSRWRVLLIVCVVAAALGKFAFAARSTGTNDLMFYQYSWRKSLEPAGGMGLYRDGISHVDVLGRPYYHEHYMNPPFVIHLLRACGFLATQVGLHFPFWMRVPSILADAAIVLLLWRMLAPQRARDWLALMAVALSPVSLLISGFHGSTDSLVVLFVLLTVYFLGKPEGGVWAGLAFGMSLNIKIWPAMFIPAILLWLPDWRARIRFSLAAGAVFAVASMPFLAQDPFLVIRRLLGYPSVYGQWGTSRLVTWASAAWSSDGFSKLFEAYGRFLMLASIGVFGWWLQTRRPDAPLRLRIAILTGVFLSFTPGFGVQYLSWMTPWLALAGVEAVMAYSFAGTVFLYVVYRHWSVGRWILADSYQLGPWSGTAIFYELFCWITVLIVTWCLWQLMPKPAPVTVEAPQRDVVKHSRKRKK
ncbi:MAG: DUF2029 domain-containing protein [Bryobacterales bacterium]|nr:DUF2029 domain-containing protein [Bryobacterales bacterium]